MSEVCVHRQKIQQIEGITYRATLTTQGPYNTNDEGDKSIRWLEGSVRNKSMIYQMSGNCKGSDECVSLSTSKDEHETQKKNPSYWQ